MDEKISKLFLPILDKLYNNEPAGEPFRKPVDPVKYGCYDYYLYVKHPIDLSTIRQKLTSHQYKDAWRFIADVQLMFSNAYLFNKRGTPVYEYTNKLSKIWNTELTPIMQRLNYCCGQLHKFGPQLLFCHGTTPDKYCQIPIGAKYKCYQDSYSFCMPCFNRIDTDYISLQSLTCETSRMNLPTQPVRKSDFNDCTNDHWQYEAFIQCSHCSRRVHQICELYPTNDDEIKQCPQHEQVEKEQREQCRCPPAYEAYSKPGEPIPEVLPPAEATTPTLDDELLQFARNVESQVGGDQLPSNTTPSISRSSSTYNNNTCSSAISSTATTASSSSSASASTPSIKNSVDRIAARLSSNKQMCPENNQHLVDDKQRALVPLAPKRDKFVCNHCYRKERLGFDLRYRKYSAKRLPHTRMSRYIETKVNEYIRENSPSAGEMTIRVLTAYRDKFDVRDEMKSYLKRSREQGSSQHPNLDEYPDGFEFTTRAIFAWQEIDGVDVCVFGMHVQEYGEDCPEPNKQIVYLSYLDSVHFFRPKQYRTAVYHEILLSYFKYVKKLGFRRVFIWVCPSRKGDDYIFYRHPSEQKMPTLKRLSDWYVHLLDKGVVNGIVERHQNIHEYALTEGWTSILSMPYLSGDYWPGEFERLLQLTPTTKDMSIVYCQDDSDMNPPSVDDSKYFDSSTPTRLDDQPLDLSINTSGGSQDSYYDDEQFSEFFEKETCPKKRRRKSTSTMGYTKKRTRGTQGKSRTANDSLNKIQAKSQKNFRPKAGGGLRGYGDTSTSDVVSTMTPEEEMLKNLERSLKRQREGFIVVRLNECDCSPHFESLRRQDEITFTCDLMRGREPFLQLARLKYYEFSTLRRAKFSSLAMVRHLGETFKLEPICNECFSFDSSKNHYACNFCEDYYLCTSCHENTHHEHVMTLLPPAQLPDIDEFLNQCPPIFATTNSTSSASSTISNKSFNDASPEIPVNPSSFASSPKKEAEVHIDVPLIRQQLSNPLTVSMATVAATTSSMPLGCKRQRNWGPSSMGVASRAEDEENARIDPFASNDKLSLVNPRDPPPSHSSSRFPELDHVLIENVIRQTELDHNIDFDEMVGESKKLLSHYFSCPIKDTCLRCRFVVMSCGFMSVMTRSPRLQMMINCSTSNEMNLANNGTSNSGNLASDGVNLTAKR